MNPSDINGDEALEARITAWILGEASAFEAAELERLCAENPDLAEMRTRVAGLHSQLVQAHQVDDTWKLPGAKREEIEALIASTPAKPRRSREFPIFLAATGIAACVTLVTFIQMRTDETQSRPQVADFSPARFEDKEVVFESAGKDLQQQPAPPPAFPTSPRIVTRGSTSAFVIPEPDSKSDMEKPGPLTQNGSGVGDGSAYGMPAVSEGSDSNPNHSDTNAVAKYKKSDLTGSAANADAFETTVPSRERSEVSRNNIDAIVENPNQQNWQDRDQGSLSGGAVVQAAPAAASGNAVDKSEFQPELASELGVDSAIANSATPAEASRPVFTGKDERVLKVENEQSLPGSAVTAAEKAFAPVGQDLLMRKEEKSVPIDDSTRIELLSQVDTAWELSAPVEKEQTKPADSLLKQLEEIPAAEEAFSTFSLNISDASFRIAEAALDAGQRPEVSSIKLEQFYNAVDYGDPAPSQSDAIAGRVEQAAHPFLLGRNLVRISLKTAAAGRAASQPLRLTLLVDQSGSMLREDRRASMDRALSQLGGMLKKDDRVSVIGFSRTSRLLADGLAGDQAGQLVALANSAASEGGTNLELALNLAEEIAIRHQQTGAQNRIVLFTDGAANLGDANPARLSEKITALRQKGISFDIAGLGTTGVNDSLLSELARHGNGRYYLVSGNDDFAAALAGAFRPAAENVKVQVRFNPERVGRYQLLGFEQDRLKTEDFHNDRVDAAELSAEEAGVAIYQVEPLAEGKGELGEVSVRFKNSATGEMIERKWTLPYDAAAPVFDRASASLQLAGLALFTAEKLRGGPLADAIDFPSLAPSIAIVKHAYSGSRRVDELLRMIGQLK